MDTAFEGRDAAASNIRTGAPAFQQKMNTKTFGKNDLESNRNALAEEGTSKTMGQHVLQTEFINKIHNESIAILPLQAWEREAINNLKNGSIKCRNPTQVPASCCPGSFSIGGGVTQDMAHFCSHTDFDLVSELAHEFVERWPTSTNSCDVCQIIELLKEHNEPLTIMGDSMTNQAFDGLMCELLRRNYDVVERNETFIDRGKDYHGWGNINSLTKVQVRSPSWPQGETVHMQMIFIYSVPFLFHEEEEMLNQAGGVLWFNFGLHDGDLGTNMESFFLTIKENATFSLLLFSETTAQHFDTPSGHYKSGFPHRSRNCTRLEWTDAVGFRDRTVRNAAQKAGYEVVSPKGAEASSGKTKLIILPFHNFTAHLYESHPFFQKNEPFGECTHYCTTPFLWVPIWRTFRVAMDTAYPLF